MEGHKRCTVCGVVCPLPAFPLRKRGTTQRRGYCRSCKADYQRAWYERNKQRHLAEVQRLRAAYRDRNRRIVTTAKSVPCADCGLCYPPYVMDFDHVRGEKVDLVPRMAVRPVPLGELMAEIAKCEVVCANCHRRRTWRRGWPRPGSRAAAAAQPAAEPTGAGQLRLAW